LIYANYSQDLEKIAEGDNIDYKEDDISSQ